MHLSSDRLSLLAVGLVLVVLLALPPLPFGLGLVWPLAVTAACGAAAGWIEGRARVRTGRRRTVSAWGLPVLVVALAVTVQRV